MVSVEMIILKSAKKHGISDFDINYVFNNAINSIRLDEFPQKVMLFGFDSKGRALEVGYITNDNDEIIIIHAMKLRKCYREYLLI